MSDHRKALEAIILVLLMLVFLDVSGTTAFVARRGVPFQRYGTGHPGGAPWGWLPSEAWVWNPDGDAPQGQIACDGRAHRLAVAGIPTEITQQAWIVNSQLLVALDKGAAATLQSWAIRKRGGRPTMIHDSGPVSHGALGYRPGESFEQNRFRVLAVPVHLQGGDALEFWMRCEVQAIEIPNIYGVCSPDATVPCASGVWLYGLSFVDPGKPR